MNVFIHSSIYSHIETHLDGVERKLYDGALLGRERFGLLADHVLLKASANNATRHEIDIMDHKDTTSGAGGNYSDDGTNTTTLLLLLQISNT